jgi:two-component system response regulator QseB
MKRILAVEDDPILLDGLRAGLKLAGFACDPVGTCADARLALRGNDYDAIILDLMLPDGSGLDLLAELRRGGCTSPILLLTALDQVTDRIAGLDAGADDYLGKPFDLDELAARIRALSRRRAGRATARVEWGGITLDPAQLTAMRDGAVLPLTRREFGILLALMERRGGIVARASLEDALYGWQEEVGSNAVEVHIHHLRAKLGGAAIETVRGVGYRLVEPQP